jgi:hypothetical protein
MAERSPRTGPRSSRRWRKAHCYLTNVRADGSTSLSHPAKRPSSSATTRPEQTRNLLNGRSAKQVANKVQANGSFSVLVGGHLDFCSIAAAGLHKSQRLSSCRVARYSATCSTQISPDNRALPVPTALLARLSLTRKGQLIRVRN